MACLAHFDWADAHLAMPRRIAIIGGGWAGLACAVELSRQSGTGACAIEVFEAASQFGGRARGLQWQGHNIDNGQHLAIGAYTKTLELLNTVNAPAWKSEPLRWAGISLNAAVAQDWTVPNAGWPWRVLRTLLPGHGPKGWPLAWRWSLAKQLRALHSNQWKVQPRPASHWLEKTKTPKDLIDHFWKPLIEGALNTPISVACAQTVANVLKDSLAGPPGATRVLQPIQNLSIDGVDPICEWLKQRGIPLHSNHRAIALEPRHEAISVAFHAGVTNVEKTFDRVVMALPHLATVSLWERSKLTESAAIQRLRKFESSAISTVWIELSEPEKKSLAKLPGWFVLNPVTSVPQIAQVGVIRGNVLALVISAQLSADDRVSRKSHEKALEAQLRAQLGIELASLSQKWITEKQATWACTPDSPKASFEGAQGFTGVKNIFRCADDLEPGYPATIESAVRSGLRCAQSVKCSL